MMKKHVKRMVSLALTGCMVMSMTACGNEKTDAGSEPASSKSTEVASSAAGEELYYSTTDYWPICEDTITISVSGKNSSTPSWEDTEFVQVVKEQMGIEMKTEQFEADAWPTQLTLMMASDELPDLFANMTCGIADANGYGQDGYLLPINEYLDIMPNFTAFLEAHPDYEAVITAPDGNIYGLTNYNGNPISRMTRTFINKEWIENLGLKKPETVDELYDVLKAFKEKDANGNGDATDEIPLTGSYNDLRAFLPWFGINSVEMAYSPVVDENGTVVLGQMTENYKEMVRFIKKLYDEGLYDVDGLVQTSDEMSVKFQENRAGMTTTGSAPFVLASAGADYDQKWYGLAGLTSDWQETSTDLYSSAAKTMVRVAVSAATEYPEAICRFIDFLFTEEGMIAGNKGFLGVSSERVAVDGLNDAYTVEMRSDYDTDYPGEYASAEEYRYKKAVINNTFGLVSMYEGTSYAIKMNATEEELYAMPNSDEYQNWSTQVMLAYRACDQVLDAFPSLPYTNEESASLAALKTDVSMYIQQSFGQFITGELDLDADWDTYIATLEQMNVKELIKVEQGAYDRAYK